MSRRRRPGWPKSCLLPPAGLGYGWYGLHEPFRGQGLMALLLTGAILGMMVPAFLVSLDKVPMLLVPPRMRARYRQGQCQRGRPREEQRSSKIPDRVRRAVLRADRYRCAWCKHPAGLNIDHIRPWAGGGLTAIWNLMTLCEACNQVKSNYWRDRDGYIHYKPGLASPGLHQAADILRYERWHRLSPARWVRAGWELAA